MSREAGGGALSRDSTVACADNRPSVAAVARASLLVRQAEGARRRAYGLSPRGPVRV